MRFKYIVALSIIMGLWGAGCSKGGTDSKSPPGAANFQRNDPPVDQPAPSPGANPDFIRREASSRFGHLEVYQIRDQALGRRREALTGKKIKRLALAGDYNALVYQVEGHELPRTVIIAPKVMFRSSITGARLIGRLNRDGKVVLNGHIALVDGTQDRISSGSGGRLLSQNFLIRNPEGFRHELTAVLGGEPNFLSNVQCPDETILHDQNQGDFTVELRTPMRSCPLNSFVPVQVQLRPSEFQRLRESFLNNHAITLVSRFRLGTPVTVSFARFQFKRDLIWEEVRKKFSQPPASPTPAIQVPPVSEPREFDIDTVQTGLAETIDTLQTSFEQCIPQEAFAPLKDRMVEEFFETRHLEECRDEKPICFRLRSNDSSVRDWQLSLRKEEYLGDPVALRLESNLSDTLSESHPFLIKAETTNPLIPPQEGTFNNTLRSIHDGEVIEFSVKKLRQSEYEFQDPQVQNISNRVCLSPFKECRDGSWRCVNTNEEDYNCRSECTGGWNRVCKRVNDCPMRCLEWEQRCGGYSQICDRRRICSRLVNPPMPRLPYRMSESNPAAPDFQWTCTNESDAKCDPDQWQDQWQRITRYSNPFPRNELQERAITSNDWEHIRNELGLHFSNGIDCRLADLSTEQVDSSRIIVRFRNTENCRPFNDSTSGPYRDPNLSIVNRMNFSSDFRCGELWENFRGERRYTCVLPDGTNSQLNSTVAQDAAAIARGQRVGIWRPYYPRTDLEAEFRFVGGYFETDPGQWNQ